MAERKKKTTRNKAPRRSRLTASRTASKAETTTEAEASRREAAAEPSESTATSATGAAQAPPTPNPPKQPTRQVVLRNTMSQLLIASVIDDDGVAREVRLRAYQSHGPVPEAHLTEHTRRLVSLGHLKLNRPT